MKKKLVSCLLAVMMLFTMAGAFADPFEPLERNNALHKFLNETDMKTKDLALQLELGNQVADLVFHVEGNSLHMVTRMNGIALRHAQMNPTALYMASGSEVAMLRYETLAAFQQDLMKEAEAQLTQAIQSIPANQLPTEAELRAAAARQAVLETAAATQEQTDAITIGTAAIAFAEHFRPESILDVKENDGSVEFSLRSDAYADALANAIDGLMANESLGRLIDRQAAKTGSKTFAEIQKSWAEDREATLRAIRTIQSTDKIEEDGHWTSSFQIGAEKEGDQALICSADTWVNEELNAAEMTFTLGITGEDPVMTYDIVVTPNYFWEKMNVEQAYTEMSFDLEDGRINSGKIDVHRNNMDAVQLSFGPDYLNMRGPKGGISSSIRETWTGKTRYELVFENAEGVSASLIIDFYEDDDSLICEMKTSESDQSLKYRISRIDRVEVNDLSASEKITEITGETLKTEMEALLKLVFPAKAPEAAAETAEAAPEEAAETGK